jgi:Ca2+-binding EF-hand superfamily protein
MFDSFDTDGDGKIDAIELGSALAHYQYAITFSDHPTSLTNGHSA